MTTNVPYLSFEATNLFNFYIEEYRRTANEINRLHERLEFLNESIIHLYNTGNPRPTQNSVEHPNIRPRRRVVRETRRTNREEAAPASASVPVNVQYTQNPIQNRSANYWTNLIREFLGNVTVAPTPEQLEHATTQIRYNTITNPINESCPISLEAFAPDEIVTRINECGHIFNTNQFEIWFRTNVRCPVCRHEIRTQQDGQEPPQTEIPIDATNREMLLTLFNNELFTPNHDNNIVMYDASNNILFFETTMHYQ